MDSIDAQCLLIGVTEGKQRPPDLWRHERSGALECCYEGGENVFRWSPDDVAAMARRWRASEGKQAPREALAFREAHERLEALTVENGLEPPDVILHDLGRAELRGVGEEKKVVLIVERVGEELTPEP